MANRHERHFTHFTLNQCDIPLQQCLDAMMVALSGFSVQLVIVVHELHASGVPHRHVGVLWGADRLPTDAQVQRLYATILTELRRLQQGSVAYVDARSHNSLLRLLRYLMHDELYCEESLARRHEEPRRPHPKTARDWDVEDRWKDRQDFIAYGVTYDEVIATLQGRLRAADADSSSDSTQQQRRRRDDDDDNDPPAEDAYRNAHSLLSVSAYIQGTRRRLEREEARKAAAAAAKTQKSTTRQRGANDDAPTSTRLRQLSDVEGDDTNASAKKAKTSKTPTLRAHIEHYALTGEKPTDLNSIIDIAAQAPRYTAAIRLIDSVKPFVPANLIIQLAAIRGRLRDIDPVARPYTADGPEFDGHPVLWAAFLEIGRQLGIGRRNRQRHVWIVGPTQSGKTSLLTAIAKIPGLHVGHMSGHQNFPYQGYQTHQQLFVVDDVVNLDAAAFNNFTSGGYSQLTVPANATPGGILKTRDIPVVILSNTPQIFKTSVIHPDVINATRARLRQYTIPDSQRYSVADDDGPDYDNATTVSLTKKDDDASSSGDLLPPPPSTTTTTTTTTASAKPPDAHFQWDPRRLCATWLSHSCVLPIISPTQLEKYNDNGILINPEAEKDDNVPLAPALQTDIAKPAETPTSTLINPTTETQPSLILPTPDIAETSTLTTTTTTTTTTTSEASPPASPPSPTLTLPPATQGALQLPDKLSPSPSPPRSRRRNFIDAPQESDPDYGDYPIGGTKHRYANQLTPSELTWPVVDNMTKKERKWREYKMKMLRRRAKTYLERINFNEEIHRLHKLGLALNIDDFEIPPEEADYNALYGADEWEDVQAAERMDSIKRGLYNPLRKDEDDDDEDDIDPK